MRMLTGIVSFLLFVTINRVWAHVPEEGKVTAVLAPFFYKTYFEGTSTSVKSPLTSGLALIAEGDIDHHGGIEIGVFFINKLFLRKTETEELAERIKQLYITMGYRHWFNARWSVAAAFYSTYIMGERILIHSTFNPPRDINTSASDTTEYGFDFSVQYEIFKAGDFAGLIDGRYSLSVTDKSNEYGDHYGFLVGLRYQIQEKYEDSKK